MFEPRTYRKQMKAEGLESFTIIDGETDLRIMASCDIRASAQQLVRRYRNQLVNYITVRPEFLASLVPIPQDAQAPVIAQEMIAATRPFGVGPMASVAGAIAQFVGLGLLEYSPELIIENGGDLFLRITQKRYISVYPGDTKLANKFLLELSPQDEPFGICTSAGKLGHSLSFGKSDAVVVRAHNTLIADAAATAFGNRVSCAQDIAAVLQYAKTFAALEGVIIIVDGQMGAQGNIKFAEV